MSKKPFLTFALATSLILGIAEQSPAAAPSVYLCDAAAACDCEKKVIGWDVLPSPSNQPTGSWDLCLRVGAQVSTSPANCAPTVGQSPGNGDEVCGWEIGVYTQGGLKIESFSEPEAGIIQQLSPPNSFALNWLFGTPLPSASEQRLGSITLKATSEPARIRVSPASRAVTVGAGEVLIQTTGPAGMEDWLLYVPEPSRGGLLLAGIATLLILSHRKRSRVLALWLSPLLFVGLTPPTRAEEPLLGPASPPTPHFQGVSLAAAGDVNGDRVADLAIGRPNAEGGRGQVALQLFRLDGSVLGTLLVGQGRGGFGALLPGANFGAAVASPGDLDGDGIFELAVAAPGAGQVWVLFFDLGPPLRVDFAKSKALPLAGVQALAALGDLNGDGVRDLAAGHPDADTGCTQDCGAVSLLALNADGSLSATLATLENGSPNLPVLGDDMRFGSSLASLGDLDGDGNAELAVGAVGGGPLPERRGSVEVLSLDALGGIVAHTAIDETSDGFADLSKLDTEIGRALATLGDVDGNGTRDLAVGTQGPSDTQPGRVALLALGTTPGSISTHASLDVSSVPAGAVTNATEFGRSLAALDIDVDGNRELAVGAKRFAPPVPPSTPDPIWLMALGDSDGDQRPNFVDNCDLVHNPLQDDADGDGVGDACDVCPDVFDPLQTDSDGDGTGDACEPTIVRLRPDTVGDPTIPRQNWTLEIECGASDIANVVVGLTPHDANVANLQFGGGAGCQEPQFGCVGMGCPTGCAGVPVDIGGTLNLATSGVLVTDTDGENTALPATRLLRDSLYVVAQGAPLLCEKGDPATLLGTVDLTAAPGVNVNPQLTPSVSSLDGVQPGLGPIRDELGATPDHYRVDCEQCAYALQPSGARVSTKFASSGGASVDYTLLPSTYNPMSGLVEVWELCFASEPWQLHRIALSVEVASAQTSMRWLGCGNPDGSVEDCQAYGTDPGSPYDSVYFTVDPAKSLSYRASAEAELYLLLQGSLTTLSADALNAVPHMDPPDDDPEMTCVARLETLPGIDPLDPSATPNIRALSGTSSLPQAIKDTLLAPPFGYCEENPVLDWRTDPNPSFPDCSGPGGQHNTSLATSVPNDVDGDERRFEDDNCPYTANTDQSDLGGKGNESSADGDGDACQCGDTDGDGRVEDGTNGVGGDVAALRDHLADPNPSAEVEARCSVGGSSACTIHDAVILQRALIRDSFEGEFVGKCAADLGS